MSPLSTAPGRFARVPAEFASYDVDTTVAAQVLGLPAEEAGPLATEYLPHAVDARRGPLFDYVDVVNLAMFGHTRLSIPDLALRFLLRFATGSEETWYEPRQWLVRVRAPRTAGTLRIDGPDETAPGIEPLDPGSATRLRAVAPAAAPIEPPGYEVAVRITGAPDAITDPTIRRVYRDVLDPVRSGDVTYQAVSERLRMRQELAWELGMADCVVVSRLLAERLRDAGHEARARRGHLLGLVGSDHAWCEVHEEGRWKALDVVFAFLAGGGMQNRRIDASPAFVEACCGSRFNRLLPTVATDARAIVRLDGEPAHPWQQVGVSAHTLEAA